MHDALVEGMYLAKDTAEKYRGKDMIVFKHTDLQHLLDSGVTALVIESLGLGIPLSEASLDDRMERVIGFWDDLLVIPEARAVFIKYGVTIGYSSV